MSTRSNRYSSAPQSPVTDARQLPACPTRGGGVPLLSAGVQLTVSSPSVTVAPVVTSHPAATNPIVTTVVTVSPGVVLLVTCNWTYDPLRIVAGAVVNAGLPGQLAVAQMR